VRLDSVHEIRHSAIVQEEQTLADGESGPAIPRNFAIGKASPTVFGAPKFHNPL
jgi:hypothetical protein